MKKFMSMLMLVLLTVSLSACRRQESTPVADFTFEVNNFAVSKESGEKPKTTAKADVKITNNSKYYVTEYPIVFWLVDSEGSSVGEFFGTSAINMAPQAEVTVPFSATISSSLFGKVAMTEEQIAQVKGLEIKPIEYNMLPSLANLNKESADQTKETWHYDKYYVDTWESMTEESFQQALSYRLTKEPKHYGGEPVYCYEASEEPVAIEVKLEENEYSSSDYLFSIPFTNNTNNLVTFDNVVAYVTVKSGDKEVGKFKMTSSSLDGQQTALPKQESTVNYREVSYFDSGEKTSKATSYTYEVRLIPFYL